MLQGRQVFDAYNKLTCNLAQASMVDHAMTLSDEMIGAIERGDLNDIENLIQHRHELLYMRSVDRDTLLHIACWQKRVDIVEYLILRGAEVNTKGCYGRTPLHYAVHEATDATLQLCKLLLNNGADKNAKDDSGFTPLTWAEIECPHDMDSAAEIFEMLR